MTRRRRDDEDGLDGDAAWRPRDDGQAALPGEETRPPWERTPWDLPGWDEVTPAQRRLRDDNAHPSGPLPQVSSGAWPPISGPQPPVPEEAWSPGEPGYTDTRREDTSYLRTGVPDPGYAAAGSRHRGDRGADYAERGLPDNHGARGEYPSQGGGPGGSGYPGRDPDYDDTGYHDGYPSHGGYQGDDYEPGYSDQPGYAAGSGYSGGTGYPDEHGYRGEGYRDEGEYPGGDYPAEPGYAPEGYDRDDYHGQSGYPDEAGYQGEAGYPGGQDDGYPGHDDTGYQADDYAPGHDQAPPSRDRYGLPRPDDQEGWYGDEDEGHGRAWGDDEYDSGVLPGFREDAGYRRAAARTPAPSRSRTGGGGPDRPRGGKPKRKSPMRRAAGWIALIVLVIILVVAGGGFYLFWHNYLHPPDYSGSGTGNITVVIKSGETATEVGQQLVSLGVVASVRAFSNAAKASGHGSSLEPGPYLLHKHMSAAAAFALLLKPSSRVEISITIPEGLRLSSIIAILGKKTNDLHGYKEAIRQTSELGLPSYAHGNPEGYLFPATYTVEPGTPPIQVLKRMVQRYDQEAAHINLPAAAAHGQISEHDAIIVASLVQAEGRRAQDFPKIARVIYNRLNIGMALQLDSTVMYALHKYGIRATAAQTKTKSPYNTYQRTGLPPGPIDSPGETAIQAALHPPHGHRDWLYFLTVNPKTGLTKFTASYSQFQTYEAELNANLAKSH